LIVNYSEHGWNVITQRSHGLLAAQICAQWRKDKQPARWVETLIATAEHDDQNDELSDDDLIAESGGPKNFKMKDFDKVSCERLLEMSLAKGRYIAILISMHMRFLYKNHRAARRYCASLARKEKGWVVEAQTTNEQVNASYELLEFCDALSLIICQKQLQPENRKMEISCGPDGVTYALSQTDNGTLQVIPWPFQEDNFEVSYEYRDIHQLSFKTNKAFRQKLNAARVEICTLKFSRPAGKN
jgi:hypothetical protein